MNEQLIAGLDLGKAADYAVMAVVGRSRLEQPVAKRRYRYALRWLQSWELGTPYTSTRPGQQSVIGDVKQRFEGPPLSYAPLAVDYTGIGMAVVEQVVAAKVRARLNPVCITAGHTIMTPDETKDKSWHVPKVELVGTLVTLLENNLLQWQSPGLPGALPLISRFEKELKLFREFITRKKNHTYDAADGQHDDIILAVSMACWLGERVGGGDISGISLPEPGAGCMIESAPKGVFDTESAFHRGTTR